MMMIMYLNKRAHKNIKWSMHYIWFVLIYHRYNIVIDIYHRYDIVIDIYHSYSKIIISRRKIHKGKMVNIRGNVLIQTEYFI